MLGLRECGQKLDDIQKQIDSLSEKLRQAYLATLVASRRLKPSLGRR
jgi:hypothetical protein